MKLYKNKDGTLGRYKIQDAETLQMMVDAYFDKCRSNKEQRVFGSGANAWIGDAPAPKVPTWTGLAIHLGLSGRQAINNYRERDEFAPVLNEARLRIQEAWEGKLERLGNNNGVIFAMSNNYNAEDQYRQKQEVDLGGQPDGSPIKTEDVTDTAGLSEDALLKIREIIANDRSSEPTED